MASLLPPVTECCSDECNRPIVTPFAGTGNFLTFDTVSEAVIYPFSGKQLCYCQGFSDKNDLNGGFWLYDPASVAAVNVFDTLALTQVAGRLLRQL